LERLGVDPQEGVRLVPKLTGDFDDVQTKGDEPGRECMSEHVRGDGTLSFAVRVRPVGGGFDVSSGVAVK
jgi:hypothetical protein